MSFAHSPKIVTDGLVLYLDAKNPKSYSGAGSTWYDLSGNGYNASKNGNATYNSNGWWEFRNSDGDSDYEFFSLSMDEGVMKGDNTTGTWTWETWMMDAGSALGNENFIVGRSGHHGGILIKSSGGQIYGQVRTPSGATGQISLGTTNTVDNQWYHVVFTYNNRTAKFYVNGELIQSQTKDATFFVRSYSDTVYIGGWPSNLYRSYNNIAQVKAYTTELSAAEVQQNYNAIKSRFGL